MIVAAVATYVLSVVALVFLLSALGGQPDSPVFRAALTAFHAILTIVVVGPAAAAVGYRYGARRAFSQAIGGADDNLRRVAGEAFRTLSIDRARARHHAERGRREPTSVAWSDD